MIKLASLGRLILLIAALIFTGINFIPTGTALANDPSGDCVADCNCTPGWDGCCLLPNGAVCHRGR